MNCGLRIADCGFGLLVVGMLTVGAYAADTDGIRHKQQAQETARALAGDLVSAVLDVQLRQLEENGLQSLPVHRDIASMKANIVGLVETDMAAVVDLLIEAQDGPPQARLAKFNVARARIRDVVVQLMVERQKLYRRMQLTRLSAEAQQLVALQAAVHQSTNGLLQHRADEREQLALEVIEDQADVVKLYYQLVASIGDVSSWGGASAAGASDGLRILRAAQVEPELKQAVQALAKAEFSEAADSQRAVLKGLRALLDKLEETQGLIDADREAALRLVRELIARQNDLREQTGETELNERTAEPLIEQQNRVQKDLSKLAAAVTKFSGLEPLVEQAKAASLEATADLFEEKSAPAVEKQGHTVAHLVQVEKRLMEGLNRERSDKSAAELAAKVARLAELKKHLEGVEGEQIAAARMATEDQGVAASHQQAALEMLNQSQASGEYTTAIDSRLEDARSKASAAVEDTRESTGAAAEARQFAVEQALAAIRTAQAEVAAELADARRRHKAVEVGELARAAEALERTAAAEEEIARLAGEAATSLGLSVQQAVFLNAEQADVGAVAERIAEGVMDLAPQAARLLEQARPHVSATATALEEALSQPGKNSKTSTARAGTEAKVVVPQLIAAAAALREEQVRAAKELESIATEQLTGADGTRQAVEGAVESAKKLVPESLERLQLARQRITQALIEQARADGRAEQAAFEALHYEIAELIRWQEDMDRVAADLARGRAINPLVVATQQQEIADKAVELTARASSEFTQPLHQAAKLAASAARETLAGNSSRAESARKQLRAALDQTLELSLAAAGRTAQLAAGPPNSAAQMLVREKIIGVEHLKPSGSLMQAKQSATIARNQLEAGDVESARAAQAEVRRRLVSAASEIDEELRALTVAQKDELAEQARQVAALNEQARQIDPGAAAALAQAQEISRTAARTAAQEVQKKLAEAVANLAARQQQLRHDRDLAQALAELAQEQQAARDAISKAAEQLREPTPGQTSSAEQIGAAQALAQAQQEFAAAQLATGEGAADVSGQQEVANQPIREGLQIASRLGTRGQGTGDRGQESGVRRQEPGDKGQETGDRQQGADNQQPGSSQKSNSRSADQNSKSADLGTKLVPASPQLTAQQIAGPQANAAAAAMAAALKGLQKGQQGEGQGDSETPQDGAPSPTAKKGGAAKSGKTVKNETPKKGELETEAATDADSRGELANQDTTAGGLKLEGEAWFAKLPPELRSAIQAKSRGKAPRGYEERLRRYFDGVD